MSLRRVTLLVVAVTFLGLVAFVTFTLESTLLRHFVQVEEQMVFLSVQRAVTAMENAFDYLTSTGKAWALRDEAYRLVETGESRFVESSLSQEAIHDLKINLVVFLNQDGEIVYQRAYNLESNQAEALPPELLEHLSPGDALVQPPETLAGKSGLLATSNGPLLLSIEPVLPSNLQGPPAGVLLTGRYLNATEILRISSAIQLPLNLARYDDPALPHDFLQARDLIAGKTSFAAISLNSDQIGGFAVLRDLYGRPAYILKTEQRRVIYQNGRMLTQYLIAAMYAAGFIFGLMTILLLEFLVLSRLTRLNSEVNQIGSSGDVSRRVSVTRRDELSNLSENINRMLATLEQTQLKRQELQEALSQRVEDLGALFETSQVFLSQLDKAAYLQNACKLAVEQFGLDTAWIGELAPDGLWLLPAAAYTVEGQAAPGAPKLALYAPEQADHPAVRACLSNTRQIENEPGALQEAGFASLAAFPLFREEEYCAVLSLGSRRPHFFSAEREQLLQAFANLSGMALHNARLFEQVLSARKRLETLSRRLVEVQEEERKWIAMELHDEIGQVLTGLKLALNISQAGTNPATIERLEQSKEMVNELIRRIRQISLELRPSVLDDLGLLPALLWQFENYTRQTHIQVHFQHANLENQRFLMETETTAYRVIQEALTNVARHAGVKEVAVRAWILDERLMIEVKDQGAGFDPENLFQDGATHGLLSIRERIHFVGGELTITSAPGKGTCLEIQLPFKAHSGGRDHADHNFPGG